VKSKRDRISRSSDWTRRYKDGGRKGKRCIGVANTKVCQEHTEVFKIGKVLLLIYSRLCIYS